MKVSVYYEKLNTLKLNSKVKSDILLYIHKHFLSPSRRHLPHTYSLFDRFSFTFRVKFGNQRRFHIGFELYGTSKIIFWAMRKRTSASDIVRMAKLQASEAAEQRAYEIWSCMRWLSKKKTTGANKREKRSHNKLFHDMEMIMFSQWNSWVFVRVFV